MVRTTHRDTCVKVLSLLSLTVLPLLRAAAASPDQVGLPLPPTAADHSCPHCGAAVCGTGRCACGGCTACCGTREVCCAKIDQVTVEESCWKVRSEKVCVPSIRFPWQPGGSPLTLLSWLAPHHGARHHVDCGDACTCTGPACCNLCPPRCGKVRSVCVLEQETYEVKRCECQWEIRRVPACCSAGCGDACDADSPPPLSPDSGSRFEDPLPAPRP